MEEETRKQKSRREFRAERNFQQQGTACLLHYKALRIAKFARLNIIEVIASRRVLNPVIKLAFRQSRVWRIEIFLGLYSKLVVE